MRQRAHHSGLDRQRKRSRTEPDQPRRPILRRRDTAELLAQPDQRDARRLTLRCAAAEVNTRAPSLIQLPMLLILNPNRVLLVSEFLILESRRQFVVLGRKALECQRVPHNIALRERLSRR